MKFEAISDNNRKININWQRVNDYVSRYKPNTSFEIEIVRRQPKVSDPMRKMYWAGIVSVYGEYLGYDKDEIDLLHRQLKIVYFQVKPDKKGIYRERDIPSVFSNGSDIVVGDKIKFIEWVVRCAAKDGCYIDIEKK